MSDETRDLGTASARRAEVDGSAIAEATAAMAGQMGSLPVELSNRSKLSMDIHPSSLLLDSAGPLPPSFLILFSCMPCFPSRVFPLRILIVNRRLPTGKTSPSFRSQVISSRISIVSRSLPTGPTFPFFFLSLLSLQCLSFPDINCESMDHKFQISNTYHAIPPV